MPAIHRSPSATSMPRPRALDSTREFFADPYRYIGGQCRALNTDVFQARLLLAPTIFLSGPRAAQLFYDGQRFQRRGAAPEPLQATLFGKRAVQSLDGPDHWRRKALFLDTLAPPAVAALAGHVGRHWETALARWPRDGVALYGAAQDVLARAVCEWAGVSLPEAEAPARTRQLVALFDDAARGLLAHGRARWSRLRLQAWLAGQVERARRQGGALAGDSPLQQVAAFRDVVGRPLDARLAATELLNVLRPVVAVSVYIVFCLHAAQAHPEVLRSRRDEPGGVGMDFLNEVRRYYPFFPAVMATVRDFEWNGYRFPKGRRAVLDLYGTNHDPRAWNDPDRFDPGRFRARMPTAFEFIPQGGADAARGHRCPGEDAALAIMKVSLDFLLGRTQCVTAGGDMALDYARLPALPRSELVVRAAVL